MNNNSNKEYMQFTNMYNINIQLIIEVIKSSNHIANELTNKVLITKNKYLFVNPRKSHFVYVLVF